MTGSQKDEIAKLEDLVAKGDYKLAKERAKHLAQDEGLSTEESRKVAHVLKITGFDPWIIGGFVFTFAVLLYLLFNYVL